MVVAAPKIAISEATAKMLRPRDSVLLQVVVDDDDDKDVWSLPHDVTGRGVECFIIGSDVSVNFVYDII